MNLCVILDHRFSSQKFKRLAEYIEVVVGHVGLGGELIKASLIFDQVLDMAIKFGINAPKKQR